MHPTDDGLEVVDVERPRVEVAVPPDDIEGMMVEHDLVQSIVLLHHQRIFAFLVERREVRGAADVALRIWRALLQLTELIAIALRPTNVSTAFEHEELVVDLRVHLEAVEDPAMDDEVIALAIRKLAVR